jgi:hypothetical protein
MKCGGVPTLELQLIANAFSHLQILNTENGVRADSLTQSKGDVSIARAEHPIIQFVQQQQVGEAEYRMIVQDLDDGLEVSASLDIPFDDPEKVGESRLRGREAIDPWVVEEATKLRGPPSVSV